MATPDPSNWVTNNGRVYGFALEYENGRWLNGGLVTSGNAIAYASDPSGTWTGVTAFSSSCNGFAYGGGNFWVAVGQDASGYGIQYSTDNGLTWVPAKDGSNDPLVTFTGNGGFGVAYNGSNKWVAVGAPGTSSIFYSSNGINWTAVSSNPFSFRGTYVKYGNGKWVAVGKDTAGNNIQTSTDGENWTAVQAFGVSVSNGSGIGYSVAYGSSGNWAAVGANTDQVNNIYYSNDNGVTWTPTLAFGTLTGLSFASIAYGDGIFVTTATNISDSVYRSTDGTGQTWVSAGLTSLGYSVQYSNGRWIAAGFPISGSGHNIAYSSDSVNWTTNQAVSGNVSRVRYGNGKWVANIQTFTASNLAYSTVAPYVAPAPPTDPPTDPPTPPSVACFLEGSKILTSKGYVPIEQLRAGDKVKTVSHGFVPIYAIGVRPFEHLFLKERIKDQLYLCTPKNYPELTEDLVITGCHSALVRKFESPEQRENTKKVLGANYVTDGHYRLPACVDQRAEVYSEKGEFNVYHIALENSDYYMNYGVYANGLLVETTSKRYLLELSGMKLLE